MKRNRKLSGIWNLWSKHLQITQISHGNYRHSWLWIIIFYQEQECLYVNKPCPVCIAMLHNQHYCDYGWHMSPGGTCPQSALHLFHNVLPPHIWDPTSGFVLYGFCHVIVLVFLFYHYCILFCNVIVYYYFLSMIMMMTVTYQYDGQVLILSPTGPMWRLCSQTTAECWDHLGLWRWNKNAQLDWF